MEQLLHYIWKHKIFPLKQLQTTKGIGVEVIDPGLPNSDSGPDFFNAKVKIGENMWVGNVEIHSKASDWFRHGIYGLFSNKIESTFKVRSLDEYASLYMNVTGADSTAYAELLDGQDKAIRKVKVVNGRADFYYLNPGKYYVRLVNDTNGNGVWDTGNYEKGIPPEEVFYYNQELELKALWEVEQEWNVRGVSLDKQKLDILKKQKPDENKKKKKSQNSKTNSSRRSTY